MPGIPEVASCFVNPSSITIGGGSNLTVTLTSPAPSGGITVSIDSDSDGAGETLVNTPDFITFQHGVSAATITLQTQQVDGAATQITFIAHVGNGTRRSAQLNISLAA